MAYVHDIVGIRLWRVCVEVLHQLQLPKMPYKPLPSIIPNFPERLWRSMPLGSMVQPAMASQGFLLPSTIQIWVTQQLFLLIKLQSLWMCIYYYELFYNYDDSI